MAEAKASSNSSDDQQKTTRKRASRSNELGSPESSLNNGFPCGACKFLRRRCVDGCIFAPHFGSDQGTALFAAVHKVFGASNVSKLLVHLPAHHQRHAVQTISFEAQARLTDPVYGCVSTIIALQQQIATLKMELAAVQNKLINNRLMVATTLQEGSQQQPEPVRQYDMQPVYSSGPSASNNSMINMDIFDSSLDNFAGDHQTALQSQEFQPSFDPQFFQPFCTNDDYEEESGEFFAFADQLLQSS